MREGARESRRTELVGLDFGASGTKVARLRRNGDRIVLVKADVLPPADLTTGTASTRMRLPASLMAHYGALCFCGSRSSVRLLDLPVTPGTRIETQIQQQLNLAGEYRLGRFLVTPPGMKDTARAVVVAQPEDETQSLLAHFSAGAPAPTSLEHSGLATLGGFQWGPGAGHSEEAIGMLDAGARFMHLFLLHRGRPVLIRRFETGGAAVVERIQTQFDLDPTTAANVLSTGAIDLTAVYLETMSSFFKQMEIARDFVERRERCRLVRLYLTGGLSSSASWDQTLSKAIGLPTTVWNPMEGVAVSDGAFPERLRGQETRFAAAIGAALGGLRPS